LYASCVPRLRQVYLTGQWRRHGYLTLFSCGGSGPACHPGGSAAAPEPATHANALRAGTAALSQIDPSIEEASISLGADNARTFRKITLPLIRPAFLAGLIYAFARSMTTISAIIFLTTPQTKIMTAQILNEVENGRYGNAFAYCVILILIVMVAIGVLYVLVGSQTGAERRIEGGL